MNSLQFFNSSPAKFLLGALLCGLTAVSVRADDEWRQWMGPNRDGVYSESGVIDSIPESGLKVKWRIPIHGGYAGPSVADGNVYVFDFKRADGKPFNHPTKRVELKGEERLVVLDAKTGQEKWVHKYDCDYNISYPAGPRCTPTVDGEHVYILGSEGDFRCLKTKDGDVVWKKNLKTDFGVEAPLWGFSSHPLVDGDLVYTMVGGERAGRRCV